MTAAENKAIAIRFIQAWSAGGQGVLDELAGPQISVHYSHYEEPVVRVENYKKLLELTHANFPDMIITVERVIAEEEQAVVFWTYNATHQMEVFNVAPTGQPVQVSGITIYRIESGKVVEEVGVVDNLALYRQLGLLPNV